MEMYGNDEGEILKHRDVGNNFDIIISSKSKIIIINT